MVNERGANRLFPAHGFSAIAPISPVCGALRGQLQDSKLHLSGSNICLAFAQLTFRESLRDIEACLRAQQPKLYHMGFRGAISEPFGVELSETVYALDSTTIDLCLSLFPWGKFRRGKSAVKLHTLLDLRGSIPTNVYVTGGQVQSARVTIRQTQAEYSTCPLGCMIVTCRTHAFNFVRIFSCRPSEWALRMGSSVS
jgi:hypothetical protein